jgi:Ca2+-binding RTX toxin-like protein
MVAASRVSTAHASPLNGPITPVSLGTLNPGQSITIIFDVTINSGFSGTQVCNQGNITADGGINTLTNDPDTGAANDPTCTPVVAAADTTPPDTTIDSNPTNPSNSSSASFTFSGTDNVTPAGNLTFQCDLDGGGFTACTSPQSYTSLSDGSHTFQVRAIDGAGNVDQTPASFTWTIDTTPPDVTIDQASGQADPTSSSTINFTAVFSEPVTGFGDSATDVSLSGTAGATTAVVTGGPTTYNVAVSGMTSSGTVIASIPANAATDAANNGSAASTSTDNTVTFTAAAPDLTISKSHTGNFTQGQTGAQYTITVSNTGSAPTGGTVTVVDTLPAGLTATAISGTGWSCTLGTLTCTRSDALAASTSYPDITLTVNVASNAPASVTNSAAVSGGGEQNTGNNTANDPTTINPASAAPMCNGQTATIYVNAAGKIVGGPDNGKTYRGELRGTNGADVIVGTNGKDEIDGKGGDDILCGGNGNDEIEGGSGNDTLFGEAGKDELKGEDGNDTLTGGPSADKFDGGKGRDTATDFNRSQGDTKKSIEIA